MGAVFTWRAVNITQQPLIIPNTTVSSGSNANVLVFRPIEVKNDVVVELTCAIAFPANSNITGSKSHKLIDIRGEIIFIKLALTHTLVLFPVPTLSVSVSSNASTVLDISGYNSFTVQCGGTFTPSYQQSGESLSFMLTSNSVSITDGLSNSSVMTTGDTVSRNSSVQQTASSASPATLVYNCTVEFSISGSLITTASNTTQVIVKGEP